MGFYQGQNLSNPTALNESVLFSKLDNTLAQMAITQTMLHYLVHPWVVYSLVGLSFSILSYRENLPMTMRSCFYPLIGDRIFSWIGDFIDVVAVISTMFGVCTSLGLGAKQLNQGLAGMFSQVNDFYRYVKDKILSKKISFYNQL